MSFQGGSSIDVLCASVISYVKFVLSLFIISPSFGVWGRSHFVIVITKTYLFNVLNSKTGVYRGRHYFFLISAQKIDCGYSLEPPRQGGSNEYPQGKAVLTSTHNLCFEQKYEKYQNFYLKTFHFWW